jgi:hypothetical protein
MSTLFGGPSVPAVPPPPPKPPSLAQPSIMSSGMAEKQRLATQAGGGFNGTDITGPQGAKAPTTTKSLLGQ